MCIEVIVFRCKAMLRRDNAKFVLTIWPQGAAHDEGEQRHRSSISLCITERASFLELSDEETACVIDYS